MKPPYLMTKDEWRAEREKTRPGVQSNLTRASKSQEVARMAAVEHLMFGIGKWIYDKACDGHEWALDCLEYGIYDRHDMIIKKAREEGLID